MSDNKKTSRRAYIATAAITLTSGCLFVPVEQSQPEHTGLGAPGTPDEPADPREILINARQIFLRPTDPANDYDVNDGDIWLDTSQTQTDDTPPNTNTGTTVVDVIGLKQDIGTIHSPDISRIIVSDTDPATWSPPRDDNGDVWIDSTGIENVGIDSGI